MKNKWINSFLAILLIFIILFCFVFINNYTNYYKIILVLFWLISLLVLYKKLGLRHNKTIVNKNAMHITFIASILYFLLINILGLFVGFIKNINFIILKEIFNESFYLIIMIICEELIRTMIAKKCRKDKRPLIILTNLIIVLDIILILNVNKLDSFLSIILFIVNGCLPILSRNILNSYISHQIGYKPAIIYRLLMSVYIYFVPIIPEIGSFLSIIEVVGAFIIYNRINKLIRDFDKHKVAPINTKRWYVSIPLLMILFVVIILVSGVFKYRVISIASESMEPNIYRGDAVIFEKINDKTRDNIDEGDIIVFIHKGNYITHRVFNKYIEDEKVIYKTKGDNNKKEDNYVVHTEDIVGVVKYKIDYLGFPSIWLQELFA